MRRDKCKTTKQIKDIHIVREHCESNKREEKNRERKRETHRENIKTENKDEKCVNTRKTR